MNPTFNGVKHNDIRIYWQLGPTRNTQKVEKDKVKKDQQMSIRYERDMRYAELRNKSSIVQDGPESVVSRYFS